MNGQTRQRKGKVTASPRAKGKGEGKGKRRHPGKVNHNQDQAGSPNEDSARWVILVLNVKELNLSVMSKKILILRLPDWIEQLLCFAFKSEKVL